MPGKSIIGDSGKTQSAQESAAVASQILAASVPVFQNVKSGSAIYAAGSPTVVNILASNVGLIRKFYLELTATVNCASGHTATATKAGIANLLSNVQFTDQNNRLRINTTGWHLHLAATQRKRRPFGAAMIAATGLSDTAGLGDNFPVQVAPTSVSGGTAKIVTQIYEIPVVNSNQDLSGAVYANQTTSNNQLQFTINPNAFVVGTADPYNAAFTMDVALVTSLPTLTSITWTLYQDFLDQLPVDNSGFAVLPQTQINFALCFQYINPGVQVQAVDNLYALPPFNIYQALMLFWDNYTYNTTVGGDLNYIKVQISNTYVLRQWDVLMLAVATRDMIGVDFPGFIGASTNGSGAVYALDFRHKPLSVNQLSSTNIVTNWSNVAAATSALNIGQEYLWYANQAAA